MGEGNEQKVSGKKIRSHGAGLAMRVSCVSIAINVVLSVFKVGAGILAHSGAMISDGVHSASDVFSTLIVMAGITMASRKSDKEHPYGHERMECVAALLLSAVLFATGIAIGVSAVETIGSGTEGSRNVPGMLALGAAVISIVVKDVLVYQGCGQEIKIRCTDGGRMASPQRRAVLSGRFYRYSGRQNGSAGHGPVGQLRHLYIHSKGSPGCVQGFHG